jgi:hypothetical protein
MKKEKLIYVIIITVVSTLAASLYVVSNNWFGKGDIQGFAFFSLVLSSFSTFLFNPLKKLFSRFNIALVVLLTLIVSVLQTTIFTSVVWLLLGPWIGAYSFPVIWCWFIGITLANFFILSVVDNAFQLRHIGIGIGTALLITVGVVTYGEIKDKIAAGQNFDIICLTYTPSDITPQLNDLTKYSLTPKEAKAILDLGLKGKFWTDKFFRVSNSKLISTDFPDYDFDKKENNTGANLEFIFGNDLNIVKNKRPKIIIIMNHPQEPSYSFKQPTNHSLVVYQSVTDDKFKFYKLGNDLNSKEIKIEGTNFNSFPYSTPIMIELKERGEFSLHGFQWMEK